MKPRNWILVLGAGLMLLAVVATLWLRYTNINQEIRQSLINAVQEAGIERFSISQARLKLNSLELHDVRMLLPEAGLDLQVDRVTALFSLMEYFNSGFDPVHSVPYFIIERPVLLLSVPGGGTQDAAEGPRWWEILRSISFIHRFFLVDGTIGFNSDSLQITPWHFSAHLGSPETDRRELALNLGPDSERAAAIQLRADVNLDNTRGMLQLHLDSLYLPATRLPSLPDGFDFAGLMSRMHFQVEFDSTGGNLRGQGQLELQDALLAGQLLLPELNLRLVGSGDSLALELREVAGFPGEISGKGVVSAAGFYFNSQVENLDLGSSRLWLEDSLIRGSGDLVFSGSGNWQAPQLALGFVSEEIILPAEQVAAAQVFLTADTTGVELHELRVAQTDRELRITGELRQIQQEWIPDLDWLLELGVNRRLAVSAFGNLTRRNSSWQLLGETSLLQERSSGRIDSLHSSITMVDNLLALNSYPAQSVDYCLQLELNRALNWQVEMDRVERLADWLELQLPAGIGSSLELAGDLEGASGELQLNWEEYLLQLPLSVDFADRRLQGQLQLDKPGSLPMTGDFSCQLQQHQLLLDSLRLDEAVLLTGEYNFNPKGGLVALQIADWPIERLELFDAGQQLPDGRVNADLELQWQGDTFVPRGYLELSETELPVLAGDRIRLETAVVHDSTRVHLWSFADRHPLLECAAVFDSGLRNGDLKLVTSAQHPETLIRSPLLLGGSVDLTLSGTLRDRRWIAAADLDWRKPSLDNWTFDRLALQLHSRPDLSSWCLDTLRMVRHKSEYPLVITGRGALGEPGDSLLLSGHGDLFELLSRGSKMLKEAESYCDFELLLTGSVIAPQPVRGYFRTSNATLRPAILTPRITDFDLDLELADGRLYIHELRSKHPTGRLRISNRFTPPTDQPELEPLELPGPGINLGILIIGDEQYGIQTVPGVELNLPGLMEEQWSGLFHFTGKGGRGNCYLAGPLETPLLKGRITLTRTEFTYPFIGAEESSEASGDGDVGGFLGNLRWDLELQVGLSNSYSKDIEGLGDWQFANLVPDYFTTIQIEVNLDPGDNLHLTGSLYDNSFRMSGRVNSTSGKVQLLNQQFTIDEAGLEFDEASLLPLVHGQASLMVADTSGFTKDIHLTLYILDEDGNRQLRGRWGRMTFDLSDDYGTPRQQILAEIGLGSGLMENPVQDISGSLLQQAMLPYMTRVEQSIQQLFGLDMVQLRTDILTNYLDARFFREETDDPLVNQVGAGEHEAVNLLAGSNFVVGKFITPNMMLSYSGTLFNQYQSDLLGDDLQYRQALKVDYRITRNLGMMVEMAYDPVFRYDERIMLRFRQFY